MYWLKGRSSGCGVPEGNVSCVRDISTESRFSHESVLRRAVVHRPVARRSDTFSIEQLGMQLGTQPDAAPPNYPRHHNGSSARNIPASSNTWVLDHLLLRDHMLGIAESIHAGGWDRARHLLQLLSRRISTTGDAVERLSACFFEALAVRYSRLTKHTNVRELECSSSLLGNPTSEVRMSAYLALNHATPFLRFAHLTATQILLEALTSDGDEFLHIVDVDIAGHGMQWPCFLQALADMKRDNICADIKRVRITGIGKELNELQRTGEKLNRFVTEQALNLPFEFIPLVHNLETLTPEILDIEEGETVGVNCILQLHTLLRKGPEMLTNFLAMLENVAPKVVTVAEAEASVNSPYFLDRFQHAWNFYSALFDCLDSTLPPSSAERAQVETDWYRGEICNVVAFEGSDRFVRHQVYSLWQRFFEGNGFEILAPSWRTVSQAQFLLKVHHPADGYQVQKNEGSVVLKWHDIPLFTVSSWKLTEMEDSLIYSF